MPRSARSIGTSTQPRDRRIKDPQPVFQRHLNIGQSAACCIVIVPGELLHRHNLHDGAQHRINALRHGLPDGVAQGNLIATHVKERLTDAGNRRGRHRPVIGALTHARHVAPHRQPCGFAGGQHRLKALQAFSYRRVDIGLGEPLGGRAKDRNFVGARGQRGLKPAHIRGQCGVAHPLCPGDISQHLRPVVHLRHPFRAHKTGHFEALKSRAAQTVNERDLIPRRDKFRFVL